MSGGACEFALVLDAAVSVALALRLRDTLDAAEVEEARTLFERMKATRWLERAAQVLARREPETAIS